MEIEFQWKSLSLGCDVNVVYFLFFERFASIFNSIRIGLYFVPIFFSFAFLFSVLTTENGLICKSEWKNSKKKLQNCEQKELNTIDIDIAFLCIVWLVCVSTKFRAPRKTVDAKINEFVIIQFESQFLFCFFIPNRIYNVYCAFVCLCSNFFAAVSGD